MNIVQTNKILNKLMVCALKEAFSENTSTSYKLLKFNHAHKHRFSYIKFA